MKVECITRDFDRVTDIFVTKSLAGKYYYARQDKDGKLTWIRQCHETEVKPFLSCSTELAKMISVTINAEFK